MDSFFHVLKQTLVASIFIMFAFVATYVPQQWNQVETVHAGGATAGALETTQTLNKIQLIGTQAINTVIKVAGKFTAWASGQLQLKEFVYDGIAWSLAKGFISAMVQSLVDWINSGFKGSPMFVQDLEGFLRNAADIAIGEYINNLGGLGSFLCSPFQLDIQIAVSLDYQRSRVDQPAPTCRLSDIKSNIDDFLSGAQGSFDQGGWQDWFEITSKPSVYTPYGSAMAAQAGARAQILNAKGEEAAYLDFGDGFLSGQICNMVNGPNGSTEECFISKPGKVIQDALSFNLDSGRQSLIAADEFNEVIAALLGQLANKALSGAAGLLGLSGGTGHTYGGYTGGSYTSQLSTQASGNTAAGLTTLQDSLQVQQDYNALASNYRPQLIAFSNDPSNSNNDRQRAQAAAADAQSIINDTSADIAALNTMINDYQDPNATAADKTQVITDYTQLTLYSDVDITASETNWDNILNTTNNELDQMQDALATQEDYRNLAQNYEPQLQAKANDPMMSSTTRTRASTAVNEAQRIINDTTADINTLNNLISEYQNQNTTDARRDNIINNDFQSLSLYSDFDIAVSQNEWDNILASS